MGDEPKVDIGLDEDLSVVLMLEAGVPAPGFIRLDLVEAIQLRERLTRAIAAAEAREAEAMFGDASDLTPIDDVEMLVAGDLRPPPSWADSIRGLFGRKIR